MGRFHRHWVVTETIAVEADKANRLLRGHQLLVKMIWSGFGGHHENAAIACNQWDMFDWQYLTDQLNNPTHNRPVYGLSNYGPLYNYTVMGDHRNRRRYFDVAQQRVVNRYSLGARGRAKPGKQTIKSGHYTLLPPHGQMTYCRGLNPSTGRTARDGTAQFDSQSRSFPGLQLGWLFSADDADGGKFKHCSETDMYGRRMPWLGDNDVVRNAMHNSPFSRSGRPDLISATTLRERQSAKSGLLPHNDCRFKATKRSAGGIVTPDDIDGSNGVLVCLNAVHKKLFVLREMRKDVPIYQKLPADTHLTEITADRYWPKLVEARMRYPRLFNQLNACQLPINPLSFERIRQQFQLQNPTIDEEHATKLALLFVMQCYKASALPIDVSHVLALNNPQCVYEYGIKKDNKNVVYALIECGADISHPETLKYLIAHWQEYRVVLSREHKARIFECYVQQYLIDSVLSNTPLKAEFAEDCQRAMPHYGKAIDRLQDGDYIRACHELYEVCVIGRGRAYTELSGNGQIQRLLATEFFMVLNAGRTAHAREILAEYFPLLQGDHRDDADLFYRLFNQCESSWSGHFNMYDLAKNLIEMIDADPDLSYTSLVNTLFIPKLFSNFDLQKRQKIIELALDPSNFSRFNADQLMVLVRQLIQVGHWSAMVAVLTDARLVGESADSMLAQFILSAQFLDLTAEDKDRLMHRFRQVYPERIEVILRGQIDVALDRIEQFDHEYFISLCGGNHHQRPEQAVLLARHIGVRDLPAFASILTFYQRELQAKNSVFFYRSRKAIPYLQTIADVLQSLDIRLVAGQCCVQADAYRRLIDACEHLQDQRMSDDLRNVVRSLALTIRQLSVNNSTINLGVDGGEILVPMPSMAMNARTVDRDRLREWRQRGYDYFRHRNRDGHANQQSVRVFTTGDIDRTLLKSLDRRAGYGMHIDECMQTKKRVICSIADMYESDEHVYPVTMVSMVAPNLRAGDRYGSSADVGGYMTRHRLNEERYYRSMHTAWSLSFAAISQQSIEQGKQSIVISPMIGGGAYLAGQPINVRRAAIRQNILAMINVLNNQPYRNVVELHVCVPLSDPSDDFDIYSYIQSIQADLPRCQTRLVFSQSDMFELCHQSDRALDRERYQLAVVNPSSDRVPGGGCYRDEQHPVSALWATRSTRLAQQCTENTPAAINLRPMALEEQLAQVTDFMYSQSAAMNPRHLTTGVIHAVDVDADRGVVARPVPHDDAVRIRSVHDILHPQPVRQAVAYRSYPTGVTRARFALPDVSSQQFKQECLRLVDSLSVYTSVWFNRTQGGKFVDIREQIDAMAGVDRHGVKDVLRRILAVACRVRGGGLTSTSGLASVEILNRSFSNFANLIKAELHIPLSEELMYFHVMRFQRNDQPRQDRQSTVACGV